MLGSVLFVGVVCSIGFYPAVLADVKSCYACAGPQSICVANNRTDFLKMDCTTFLVEGQSLVNRTAEPDLLEKFDSEVGSRTGAEIGCIALTFTQDAEDPRERAFKSCIPAGISDQDICSYMASLVSELGGNQTSCSFCEEDDCNGAISIVIGKPAIFIFSIILFYRNHFCF